VDPKPLDSTLVAVADRPGRVILFARVGREVQFKQWLSGSGWGAWTSWGPTASRSSSPACAVRRRAGGCA
jgi:hypothetical protein